MATWVVFAAFAAFVQCSSTDDLAGTGAAGDASANDAPSATDAPAEAMACGDVANDPRNCGRCGHDCVGGACSAGVCQPVVVAFDQRELTWVGVDASHVFWLAGPEIHRAMKNGAASAPIATGATRFMGINGAGQTGPQTAPVFDDTSVYYVETGGTRIVRIAKDGGAHVSSPPPTRPRSTSARSPSAARTSTSGAGEPASRASRKSTSSVASLAREAKPS
jgi:hypothetical protein